jgi:hypothetical protein
MSLGEQYLIDRGIPIPVATVNGIEFDLNPTREEIEKRLGVGCVPLWKTATEILWIRVYTSPDRNKYSWLARPFPVIDGQAKFVAPTKKSGLATGIPYVPILVWNSLGKPSDPSAPLLITEGPIKSLALVESGKMAVGINGVFGANEEGPNGKLVLRKEILDLGIRGRKIYFFFDADASINPKVRRAEIRLFFLCRAAGAEVFRATSWDASSGKGIDDYIVGAIKEDPDISRETIVEMLIKDAQPFIASVHKRNTVDLDIVESELEKVSLSKGQRGQLCKELAGPLGVQVGVLRKIGAETDPSHKIIFPEIEPWPEVVDIDELIEEIQATVSAHIIVGDPQIFTGVLWGILSFLCDSDLIDILPFLSLSSPEKRCGKSRFQSVLSWIARRALSASNISSAAVYRTVEACRPTLLLDEVDTFVEGNEELRGILNSGRMRDKAFVIRCNPVTNDPERFCVWAPKCVALIGTLPGTLQDRSIEIRMERKKHGQKVKPLWATSKEKRLEFYRKLLRWTNDNEHRLCALDPATLELLNDRDADNWTTLLQVAMLLGKRWLDKGYETMRLLTSGQDGQEPETRHEDPLTALKRRLRQVFYDHIQNPAREDAETVARGMGLIDEQVEAKGKEAAELALQNQLRAVRDRIKQGKPKKEELIFIPTAEILEQLNADKEAPWADWGKGKQEGLTQEKLSRMLRPYKVRSIRLKRGSPHGYTLEDLLPVFERYLEDTPDGDPVPEESAKDAPVL